MQRLPGCDGQAADAVSASTQVKLEDAPRLLKIPLSGSPDVWIRLPRHIWPKQSKIPWYLLNETCTVIHEPECYGTEFEEALLEFGWEKIQNWESMFDRRKQELFLSVFVDDITNGWKGSRIWLPCEELDEKTLILTNPHHFLTMCAWRKFTVIANRMKQTDGEGQKSSQGSGSKQENSMDKSEIPCRFRFCTHPSCKFYV